MLLLVQAFPCAADNFHQRCNALSAGSRYSGAELLLLPLKLDCSVWSQPLSGVRPVNAFVPESLPAVALLIFNPSTDWSRDKLRFHPPFPYCWATSLWLSQVGEYSTL